VSLSLNITINSRVKTPRHTAFLEAIFVGVLIPDPLMTLNCAQLQWIWDQQKGIMKRIKHNDLTHYFLRDHKQLPATYLASCEKFFKSIKQQAASNKPQASSLTSKSKPDIG